MQEKEILREHLGQELEQQFRDGKASIDLNYHAHQTFSDLMLKFPFRDYIIWKVKAPMMKALIKLAERLPKPTRQNCFHPNTHVWMTVWDKFFQMENNSGRRDLFRAIERVFLSECEHDIYYRDRMNVMLELWLNEVLEGKWKPRSLDHPNEGWRSELDIKGKGYEFLVDRYYRKDKYKEQK